MKLFQLVCSAVSRDLFKRILVSLELIVGLVLLYLCTGLLEKYRSIDQLMEKYADMAAVEPNDPEQIAYAQAHGTLFEATVMLTGEKETGAQRFFGEINSLAYYQAVPMELAEGTWFEADVQDCQYLAVVPYSLRGRFPCGQRCELYFLETGPISTYVCGVMPSDLTFGNTGAGYFDDTNLRILLCPTKAVRDYTEGRLASHRYVKLDEIDPGALRVLDIDAVALVKDRIHEGNRQSMAAPGFLCITLLVLFGTALLGEVFLSARENEKDYAIRFLCGASVRKAVLIQGGVNIAIILIPYLLSLVAAFALKIRLYLHSTLWPLLALTMGSVVLSFVQLTALSRKSPAQIIGRRFRQ